MALTGDIVVEDNAVLSLAGNQADLRAMQSDPQSIVLNGGVLDLSDFTTGMAIAHTMTVCKSAAAGDSDWQ